MVPKAGQACWDDAAAADPHLSGGRRPPQQGDRSPCSEHLRERTSRDRRVWLRIIPRLYLESTIKPEAGGCACTRGRFCSVSGVAVHNPLPASLYGLPLKNSQDRSTRVKLVAAKIRGLQFLIKVMTPNKQADHSLKNRK